MHYRFLIAGWVGMLLLPAVVCAQFWGAKAPVAFETAPDQLKQGSFTWKPELAPEGPVLVLVSLTEQIAYTYRNGIMIGACKVSTGKPGHETPTGIFHTRYKDADHRSSKYNNAAMPYTQMLTSTGVALHAGGLPGYPSSHGCIHLPSRYAELLYQIAPVGMTVVISKNHVSPDWVVHPAMVAPVTTAGTAIQPDRLDADELYRWQPDFVKLGPLSIIISKYDKRALVLRNGKEQGRSRVDFEKDLDSIGGTHLLIAGNHYRVPQDMPAAQKTWVGIALNDAKASLPDENLMQHIKLPAGFLNNLYKEIEPGTTIVFTEFPILEHTTGTELVLFTTKTPAEAAKTTK